MEEKRKRNLYVYLRKKAEEANRKYALAERYQVENEALAKDYVHQAFKIDDDLHLIQEALSIVGITFNLRYSDRDDSLIVSDLMFGSERFLSDSRSRYKLKKERERI